MAHGALYRFDFHVKSFILHQDIPPGMRISVTFSVMIPTIVATMLLNEFLFENYFKLYEKAQQMGDSKLSATAKALKYALVFKMMLAAF